MQADLSLNPAETADKLINFIKITLQKTGFSRLVVGLSGGIDSATSLALGVEAAGVNNIYAGIFPYGELNKEGTADAKLIADKFQIPPENVVLTDIKPLADPILVTDPSMSRLRRGNIMVRTRMVLLYDLAKRNDALVLGTENKTENLLGYFTRFGDEASDLEPLINLYKTQVKKLAKYLGVPDKIITKTPTAGMWPGQTDEGELGFTYEEADKILHFYCDKKNKKEEIIKVGFAPETVEKVIKRLNENSFKHGLPYTPD